MKKTFLKNLPFLLAGVCVLFLPASFAFAADTGNGFVALAPIPGVTDASASNFGAFFNSLFRLLIVGAGILAVIRIGWAGIVYMTTESTHGKGEAKEKIEDAVIGLLLALGTFLILSIINPNLTIIGGISTINVAGDNFAQKAPTASRPATPEEVQKIIDQQCSDTAGGAAQDCGGAGRLVRNAQATGRTTQEITTGTGISSHGDAVTKMRSLCPKGGGVEKISMDKDTTKWAAVCN